MSYRISDSVFRVFLKLDIKYLLPSAQNHSEITGECPEHREKGLYTALTEQM